MQHEITSPHDLLLPGGSLAESGWARKPLLRYNREQIPFPPKRFKEWHYFFCGDETFGIGFSIANIGPLHNYSISFLDFKNKTQINASSPCLPKDSLLVMPEDSYGSLRFKSEEAECGITGSREKIVFKSQWKNFKDGDSLVMDFTLWMPQGDTLYHCFPFTQEAGQFFYAHKIAGIPLEGSFSLGALKGTFDPERAFAVQDWGRGIWPRETHAYWGGGSGKAGGKRLSFNIGWDYKHSDTSAAGENAIFCEGRIHKIGDVVFHVDENQAEWLKPWTFTSPDRRFELTMEPILDRRTEGPLGPSHQVFGYYSGEVELDGGERLALRRVFGFAEKNIYRWGLVEDRAPQ
ncbi:MAG: DUF2804 domain-containing protein [Spirochaetales bacterium]|jgi:hypothetical protein|nr:DUF2804 domain-containing protein [Spirochaetales bacterium]